MLNEHDMSILQKVQIVQSSGQTIRIFHLFIFYCYICPAKKPV
jgi:hypothetical protein